ESVSAQTARSLLRAKKEATSSYRLRSFHNGSTLKILRMALDLDGRQTGHADPLASKRIPMFLEMEVSFERSAESSDRSTKVDRPHGFEQSHVGGGKDRKRAFVEDWNSDSAAHGSPLHAGPPRATHGSLSAVDDLRTQSCQGAYRRGLLRSRDRHISVRLRALGYGNRDTTHPSPERDSPSD